ncbi:MAG: hypothetical protein NBV77_02975 [Bacteroidia bacterium]|nr:hypothetical protein [Bacteroidia bacterium]
MHSDKKWIVALLILAFIIDYIDQRYFYYFYKNTPYTFLGVTFHFSVFLRYILAAFKWIITYKLFPKWFHEKAKIITLIFIGLIFIDACIVLLIKKGYSQWVSPHNLIYNSIRLKPLNNYFLGFLAALSTLHILSKSSNQHENSNQ